MTYPHHGEAFSGTAPENYERYFVPVIAFPAAIGLIKIASLRPGERVLDVACGTGVAARLASAAVGAAGTVAGVDIDPGMLAVARSTTPPDLSIEWHEASAEAMPLPDASFDAVLCQMGLQFVPDKDAALHEVYRVLSPGGRLVLSLPGPTPPLFAVMEKALAHHVGGQAAGFVGQVFALHDTASIQQVLESAGFVRVTVQAGTMSLRLPPPAEFLWQYVHSTPLAGIMAEVDTALRSELEQEVTVQWQEFIQDGELTLQARVVTATARK